MKEACGEAHMKTILATGELGSLTNVYRASMVCMMAGKSVYTPTSTCVHDLFICISCTLSTGADFIKTSTGKEGVNAILPVALVMVRAIREYFQKTGFKVTITTYNVSKLSELASNLHSFFVLCT